MDDQAIKERIEQLAQTLQATGIAASKARAEEMAADIVATEQKQLEKLEAKKHDKSLNPQQSTGSEASAAPTVNYTPTNVDTTKPISELLAEDDVAPASAAIEEPAPVAQRADPEQTAQQIATPELESAPEVAQTLHEPVPQPAVQEPQQTQEVTPEPAPTPQPTAQEPQQEAPTASQETTPEPVAAVTDEEVAKELSQTEPTQEAEIPEAPSFDSEEKEPEKPKSDQPPKPKVDLTEMFNFSKR